MPFYVMTEMEGVGIRGFIVVITLSKIRYRLSICIILHQARKDDIRKFFMVVQQRVNGTFRFSSIHECIAHVCLSLVVSSLLRAASCQRQAQEQDT